jgi:hypothetical protein
MIDLDLSYAVDVLRFAQRGGSRVHVPTSAQETVDVLVALGWIDLTEQWVSTVPQPVTLSLSRAGQVALALALRRV